MELTAVFKALSDSTRLEIVRMLAEREELCACRILERFDITQPTLSHHMKSLCGCGLVNVRREGIRSFYSLDRDIMTAVCSFFASPEV